MVEVLGQKRQECPHGHGHTGLYTLETMGVSGQAAVLAVLVAGEVGHVWTC